MFFDDMIVTIHLIVTIQLVIVIVNVTINIYLYTQIVLKMDALIRESIRSI